MLRTRVLDACWRSMTGEASCRRNDGGLRGQRFCDDGFLCSSSLKPSMRMSLVGIPLDVGHAMLAVVAQGRIVIVGQQLGSVGFFRVAEQRLEIAGGREVPGAQGSFGGLLERPVLWFGHGDHLSGTGAGSARMFRASRIIWWVKPHSLSYQAITLTRVPSTTVVSSRSTTAARGSPTMSADTSGSSETPSTSW